MTTVGSGGGWSVVMVIELGVAIVVVSAARFAGGLGRGRVLVGMDGGEENRREESEDGRGDRAHAAECSALTAAKGWRAESWHERGKCSMWTGLGQGLMQMICMKKSGRGLRGFL